MEEHAGIEPTLPNFFISWEKETETEIMMLSKMFMLL